MVLAWASAWVLLSLLQELATPISPTPTLVQPENINGQPTSIGCPQQPAFDFTSMIAQHQGQRCVVVITR